MFYHLPGDEGEADGLVVSWVLLAALFEDRSDGDFPPELAFPGGSPPLTHGQCSLCQGQEWIFPQARAGAFRILNEIIWWPISKTIISFLFRMHFTVGGMMKAGYEC